jgi:large subunit ribosomal protein L13
MAGAAAVSKARGFKTFVAKPGEIKAKWYLVDASDQILGRLASAIAVKLMGKDKPVYTPHLDTGDFVVVINAERIKIDPRKRRGKIYQHWSGYMGGLKQRTFAQVQARKPEFIITQAVRLMLPKNLLAKRMLRKLLVYRGGKHPHAAQKPEAWKPLG